MSAPIAAFRACATAAGLLLLLLCGAGNVQALDRNDIGKAEVVLEQPQGGAIEGEMVLLRFRAAIHGISALDELRQPALADLDWKQLGRDRTYETTYKGFAARGYERDIAIYPQRSGTITIDRFVYHLTMIDENNKRVEVDLESAPVSFDVRPLPAGANSAAWLPAKSLTVTDAWDKRPDRLAFGETVRRTVTVEAEGIGAEHLSPPPLMRAPGVISFAGPVERSTRLTPQGPVARAVYRWDIRPTSRTPAVLPAFPVRWFDTVNRYAREAVIPEQRISLAAAYGASSQGEGQERPNFSIWRSVALMLGSLVWGMAGLFLWKSGGHRASVRKRVAANLLPLRKAARAGDPRLFRRALSDLMRADPGAARLCTQDVTVSAQIAALDAFLFGKQEMPPPALNSLCKHIAAALRANDKAAAISSGLAPLDGPPRQTRRRSPLSRWVALARSFS